MRFIVSFLFCSLPLWGISQIQLSQTNFDLGEISLLNSDIVDFDVKNISLKNIFLLRIEGEQTVRSQYTSKSFNAGATEGIQIKLNPDKKGKIERKVKLYFSNNSSPIEITVKAIVKDLPKNNRTACPKFGSALKPPTGKTQPVTKIQKFELFLYDSESKDKLALAAETAEAQEVKATSTVVETPTNTDKQSNSKIEKQPRPTRNTTRKNPDDRRNSPSLGQILFGSADNKENAEVDVKVEEVKEAIEAEEQVTQETSVIIKEQESEKKAKVEQQTAAESNLLDQSYKPNNVVFLIDASTSMREEQKMDILKKAMIELLEPLREIDYITIVTYSGEANVVLPTSKGNLKAEIALQIENLKADGSTNAVKGIKKAIQVGKNNFLQDGNNQIFLASDGAFNIGENNMSLRKKIKKTANEGLTITVLGIKNDNWTNKSLKELAELGDGDLIKIKSMRDANKVVQSMKKKALR
ncbi:VWA domain-containing protein [Vicingaceae bacterium]|nr:VWA domain-containing protein [Vicingaceae bacterium]MDB4061953.1 VWA domain-containing protein [Vicingaceae bacterium]